VLFREQIAGYLTSHVNLEINDRVQNLRALRWKVNGRDSNDGFLNDTPAYLKIPAGIMFGGKLPKDPKRMSVNILLFAEFGVIPISEVSLYWKDSLLVRQWLGLDRTLRINISSDSLAAMLKRAQEPPSAKVAHSENLAMRFIGLGFTHILPEGLDHILFVLGLFFFATRMRPLLWQITAFTIAHSITLGLAMAGTFSLPSHIVEPLIALSIAVVGIENIFFRKVKASRWLIVFCFGLIHGMGFASALRGLGLPKGNFWTVLASFNVGVELGQLTIVTTAFLITRWMWNKPWYFKRVVVPISSVISVVALYWVVQRVVGF